MNLADQHALMHAQLAERRETGRPIGAGDLVAEPGRGYHELADAGNAGDCAEAHVLDQILKIRSERRDSNRG